MEQRRKKGTTVGLKKKLMMGLRGSISILLCLLLTPFMTIALGLVEYARYQQVMEVTDEIYELTGVSALSNYDPYIHKRFGLLAMAQNSDPNKNQFDGIDLLLQENLSILGKQAVLSNPSVRGTLALSNEQVLRKQLMDFGELTTSTAIFAKDFDLDELMDQLNGLNMIKQIMDNVNAMADIAEALKKAVEAVEALKANLELLKTQVTEATNSAKKLSENMSELYNTLGENGITLPQSATEEEIEAAIESFKPYVEDLKELYIYAKTLIKTLGEIKETIGKVKSSAKDVVDAVKDAREAFDRTGGSEGSQGSEGIVESISDQGTELLKEVLEDLEKLVENTLSEITDELVNSVSATADEIIDRTVESIGLGSIISRYEQIVNGSYFSYPLNETAKQDIIDLLKTVKTMYEAHSGDALRSFLREKLIPNLNIDPEALLKQINTILEKAANALCDKITDSLLQFLTSLINTVRKLFEVNLFYDADLNACVNLGQGETFSSYQTFLNAIGGMFDAVDDLKEAIKKGIFGIAAAFKAIGDIGKSIVSMMSAIWDIASDALTSVGGLLSAFGNGDYDELYEKLIISGYMRHNLPSRVDAGDLSFIAGSSQTMVRLKGNGIANNFPYNEIPRPAAFTGQTIQDGESIDFTGLGKLIDDIGGETGTDTMFKGAELEYIRAGTSSELANQVICFFDLYFLRLILDVVRVIRDDEVRMLAASASIAAWVVYIIYILAEPLCDTLLMVNGIEVPLIKTQCYLTVGGITGFMKRLNSAGQERTGEAYKKHMLILLFIYVTPEDQLTRLKRIIDLETTMYYTQQGGGFNINNTFTAVQIEADVKFSPFFDLGKAAGGDTLMPSYRIQNTIGY